MGVLTVYLDKISNLMDEEWIGKSDPYVKFQLKRDGLIFDKDFGEQRSSKKGGDLHPNYDETFVFENIPGLRNLELICTVLDDDGFLGDDKMGKVTINLDELDLSEEETGVDRTVADYMFHKDAHIFLRLKWSA